MQRERKKNSYLLNCKEAFLKSMKMAETKEQFIQLMHAQGFSTEWKDNKKHITFTDIKRKNAGEKKCKVRLNKLAQYFSELKNFKTKENLEYGLKRNSTTRIEPNDNRSSVERINSNKSETGRASELIDFNKEFEEYSSRFDKERVIRTAEANEECTRNHIEPKIRRIAEQQKTARFAAERNEKNGRRNEQKDSIDYGR